MTTRKELIERIQAMQLGTQEMLDAAAGDATLIPFDTLFIGDEGGPVWRKGGPSDDYGSVRFTGVDCEFGPDYYDASELRPMPED